MKRGVIRQVSGSVVDVEFEPAYLPRLQEALTVQVEGRTLTMEAAQHIGRGRVRCIMLAASEGLARGMSVTATGNVIQVPVGEKTLGRMLNVLGDPIDGGPPIEGAERWPIHHRAPSFVDQAPAVEVLETGIKVIDLLEPYPKGGKIGLFGGAARRSMRSLPAQA